MSEMEEAFYFLTGWTNNARPKKKIRKATGHKC